MTRLFRFSHVVDRRSFLKRRDFLASVLALAATAGEAHAANKKTAKKPATSASSKSKKAASNKTSNRKASSRKPSRSARSVAPAVPASEQSVIDHPLKGTSATRLPPTKAPDLPTDWRTYEITTLVKLPPGYQGPAKLWLPLAMNQDTLYQRVIGHQWQGNTLTAGLRRLPDGELEVLTCEWRDAAEAGFRLISQISTADRQFDVSKRSAPPDREDILRKNLAASSMMPTEGLIQALADSIVGRVKDPVAQVKAIFDWVIDNSRYDPTLPGCGSGDIHQQLARGNYGGRSADINGLFVALCRTSGIPARCSYGLRIGSSNLFPSLGLSSDDATQGFHVRAEFYIPGYGWIGVDPSDVRRAMTLDKLSEHEPRLAALRRVMFGVWEMNWIALNTANDVKLPDFAQSTHAMFEPRLSINGNPVGPQRALAAPYYRISARQIKV